MTETTTPKTSFPERMHEQAVHSHRRRAVKALTDLMERAAILRDKLEAFNYPDAESAASLGEMATRAAIHLSALEVLRETREWDEAEKGALEPLPVRHHPDLHGEAVTIDARRN